MLPPLDTGVIRCLPASMMHTFFEGDKRFLFGRMGVHGDGTCFFHSLCAALNYKNYLSQPARVQQQLGHEYRSQFRQHVTPERWSKFVNKFNIGGGLSVDTVKKHFHDNKHWADETMIKFVSHVLKMNIIFIDTYKNKIYCGVRGHKDEPLVIILWVQHSHFEPVMRILNHHAKQHTVDAQFQFSLFNPSDREVVDGVMSSYAAQCSV